MKDANATSAECLELTFQHPALDGKYALTRRLGQGSQGQMFLAQDLNGREVAIKAYDIARMANWKATELFEREMETMLRLNINGVPKCYETIDASGADRPFYFIVQEFVPGESLLEKLNARHRFDMDSLCGIMRRVVEILDQLATHSPPVIHRDIKPSNIMLTPKNEVFLVDFGASVRNTYRMGGSTFAGTAGYMAPEQAMGEASPASDIYGLGATMVHLVCNTAPYDMNQNALKIDFYPHLPPTAQPWLIALLTAMINPLQTHRPAHSEILYVLEYKDVSALKKDGMSSALAVPEKKQRGLLNRIVHISDLSGALAQLASISALVIVTIVFCIIYGWGFIFAGIVFWAIWIYARMRVKR